MNQLSDNLIFNNPKIPITLVGNSRSLSGIVSVSNTGTEQIVLNPGMVSYASLGGTGDVSADEIKCAVTMLAIVAPYQSIDVPISVMLSPFTAPGLYQGVLTLGASTCAVNMFVPESIHIRVTPAQIIVANRPGKVSKNAVIINDGNVPVTVGSFGAIPLNDESAIYSITRAALENAPADLETFNQWTTHCFRAAADHVKNVGLLTVDLDGAPVTVAPGQSSLVTLSIIVPDLDQTHRYTVDVNVCNTEFEIIIAPAIGEFAMESTAVRDAVKVKRRPK